MIKIFLAILLVQAAVSEITPFDMMMSSSPMMGNDGTMEMIARPPGSAPEPAASSVASMDKIATISSQPCPDCFVTQVCGRFRWTRWFDRDDSSGTGDWETVADLVSSGGCAYPIMIECQTTGGIPWWKTGEVLIFAPGRGCICINAQQPDGVCNYDYTMRQLCP